MSIIDIHTHIYPDKIAMRAARSVGDFYQIPMCKSGTVDELFECTKDTPITHFCVHSVAIKPSNVCSINDFIASACNENKNFVGFATMHQDFEDPESEIDRAIALGLHGIKIHPDTQMVNMDDERLMHIYEIMEAKKLPLIVHTGDYRYSYSHPKRLINVLRAFPNLIVDAAHFGGWSIYDLAVEYLEFENCYLDTSSSRALIGGRRTKELIDIYGHERIMFGSDYPMWSPQKEFEDLDALDLSDDVKEDIFCHNAERFLNMKLS